MRNLSENIHAEPLPEFHARFIDEAALHVLNNASFKYLREVVSGSNYVLEFHAVIGGITVNGGVFCIRTTPRPPPRKPSRV